MITLDTAGSSTGPPAPCTLHRARGRAALIVLLLLADAALAEAPVVQLRPFAPGGIAIDWEHPGGGAGSITLEREEPPLTRVFEAFVNSVNDLGLQAGREYRYRVCASYADASDCSPWLSARTLPGEPPYVPPAIPVFTSTSSTPDSVTVNWTSSSSYGFHQVRWAQNGQADVQDRVRGRTFTASGLRPGTYHFIVQGCNTTLLGSSCSRFSLPIEVATRARPAPIAQQPAHAVVYALAGNGELRWYRHDGRHDGSFAWGPGAGNKVGSGWNAFSSVLAGGNGVLYALEPVALDPVSGRRTGGHLVWYRHDGWRDGRPAWVGPRTVGDGWSGFASVFSAGDGVVCAITSGGDLLWYRHEGRNDGRFAWAAGAGSKVGSGWGGFAAVLAAGNGVLYALEPVSRDPVSGARTGGRLLWYRHDGWLDGRPAWVGPTAVGSGWGGFHKVFSGGDGVIYAIAPGGELRWYHHAGWRDGSVAWAPRSGKTVGTGWGGFANAFATPSCGYGSDATPC